MKLIKKTKENTIYQKRSGRYAVEAKNGSFINGEEKAKILAKAKLIKLSAPGKKPEPVAEEAPATEESAE